MRAEGEGRDERAIGWSVEVRENPLSWQISEGAGGQFTYYKCIRKLLTRSQGTAELKKARELASAPKERE